MLHLSALALGPLLARAAPKIGSGKVDYSTTISQWLFDRYADPTGKLAKVLTRVSDRAWRSFEIAVAGEDLHRCAIGAGVDRALVEQLRQFVAAASIPARSERLHQQLLVELQKARQADLIPGPVPSSNSLAASVIRYLGATDEFREIDAHVLIELGHELRTSGFGTLAGFVEKRPAHQPPLLITAVRYYLAREIGEDLSLLRDLRYTRLELIPDNLRIGFDRLADALDRFTTTLNDLLSHLISSAETSHASDSQPVTAKTQAPEPGYTTLGEHLVSPIRLRDDGARISPCPVCLTNAELDPRAGPWVSLSCQSCGTDFQATDGTAPPPPPVLKIDATLKTKSRSPAAKNLQLWIDSGNPIRWLESYHGLWSDREFGKLTEMLRVSQFWPLELADVHKVLTEMALQYRTRRASWGGTPTGLSTSPPLASSRGLVRTSDYYRAIDGSYWVPCPLCRSFNVEIPTTCSGEVKLTCSGCWRSFLVVLKKKPSVAASTIPPSPPPTLLKKIRRWFGA